MSLGRVLSFASLSVLALTLFACGGSGSSGNGGTGGGGGGTTPGATYIYTPVTVTTGQDALNSYATADTGTASPLSAVTPAANTEIGQLSYDSAGHIYALAYWKGTGYSDSSTVYQYTPSGGHLTQTGSLVVGTNGNDFVSMTADRTGKIYAATSTTVFFYSGVTATSSTRSMTLATQPRAMATDSAGNLWVLYNTGVITEYGAGITSSTPQRSIDTSTLNIPNEVHGTSLFLTGIAFDSSDNLYYAGGYISTAGSNSAPVIAEWSKASAYAATPTRLLYGTASHPVYDQDIAVDAAGTIYTAAYQGGTGVPTFLAYSTSATSLDNPTSTFTTTNVYGPTHLFYGGLVVQ